jgi:hypothetical protein
MNDFKLYSDLGWYLFPLLPRSKAPATANGFKDATNDYVWWKAQSPESNWGLSTGPSRIIAVDLDLHKGGSLEAVESFTGALPETARAKTGGGGMHLLFALPVGPPPPTRLNILKGVDIMAATGYIVLPPSIHPNGTQYAWERSPSEGIAVAPQALIDFILTHKNVEKTNFVENGEELFLGAGDGRWDKLRKFAGRMRTWGWAYESILIALQGFVDNQCEIDETISSTKIEDLARFVCRKPAQNNQILSTETVRVRTPDGAVQEIPLSGLHGAISNGAVFVKEIK